MHRLDFSYEGGRVGYFEEPCYPCSDGHYRYMQYRSGSHYLMSKHLKAGQQPRCYYEHNGLLTTFTVRECPEYGVLYLIDFQVSPKFLDKNA